MVEMMRKIFIQIKMMFYLIVFLAAITIISTCFVVLYSVNLFDKSNSHDDILQQHDNEILEIKNSVKYLEVKINNIDYHLEKQEKDIDFLKEGNNKINEKLDILINKKTK